MDGAGRCRGRLTCAIAYLNCQPVAGSWLVDQVFHRCCDRVHDDTEHNASHYQTVKSDQKRIRRAEFVGFGGCGCCLSGTAAIYAGDRWLCCLSTIFRLIRKGTALRHDQYRKGAAHAHQHDSQPECRCQVSASKAHE